jgi:hypothetical protein
MGKKSFVPGTDAGKKDWQHNLGDKIGLYKTKYNITNAEETDTQDGDAYFAYWLNVVKEVTDYKEKVTAFKNELRDGVAPGATGMIAPVAPVFAAAPTAVQPGIFPRSISIGNRIKKHNDYVMSDGQDMDLEGANAPTPDLINSQPLISIVLMAGQPLIKWTKAGFNGLYIMVDRGTGAGFQFLALDSEPDYLDTFTLPATATEWKYKAIYIFHDDKVAMWSNEVSINVKA